MTAAAFLYDDDAYVEKTQQSTANPGEALGLMGRQVAGKEFLDAYLAFGHWTELIAVCRTEASARSLTNLWHALPAEKTRERALRLVPLAQFHQQFLASPPAHVLHFPNPLDPHHAWARQHAAPGGFAFSGLTHTICTWERIRGMCEMVTAPFESFDVLCCISRAALQVVKTVTGTYADYLRERHGGQPGSRVRLEHLPLGVNTQKYRPATASERAAARFTLGIAEDEIVVLFVGRLSFHAKVHPYPIYAGVARAAWSTGKKVHLVLAGWAVNAAVLKSFADGAEVFAPFVRVSIVDGTRPDLRFAVWHAADIATSLTDNIQETLSQVILEGMACGLPVVATNWDGCKDQVIDGETGLLVPAYMMRDATRDQTSRLIVGEINYDYFLAECNQTVAVDVAAAGQAFARLIADPGLRKQMGAAGRQRILESFTWEKVVHAYEALWQSQEAERQAFVRRPRPTMPHPGPACFSAPEHSFASYPTTILGPDDLLTADPEGSERLDWLLKLSLTNYCGYRRTADPALLRSILERARQPATIAELDQFLADHQVVAPANRATLAWMVKYGMLRATLGK